ncbi:amidohydrolase family protein [Curtobacterium sp. MCBD17_003]|uniref:amidohydrolase family protein n=1 Tax=Curtobacterium sp. MCBD17_003 TaxID=2175667 RepID=UPI0015E88DC4|nr:amidohydrolase family protein [Curtobacterium sp. MCBD17_003]WIE54760.1 amidohydrolase family protein [Curtobacterium sp. MCBD17_003]
MNDHALIDIHAHFTAPTTEDVREAAWRAMRADNFMAPAPHVWSPERAIGAMDANGIGMQLLSTVPTRHDALVASNTYGATVVAATPNRFGLLAALSNDDPDLALREIRRARTELDADGFAMSTTYNAVTMADSRLEPVWKELNDTASVVFVHPDTSIPSQLGLPTPLIEVTFETARVITSMLYARVFSRFPNITFVLAHCGGALPGLSGRISLIGTEPWVSNPNQVTSEELRAQMGQLFLDTAASGTDANLAAALQMVPVEHIVYGGDSGVPCTNDESVAENLTRLRTSSVLHADDVTGITRRALTLFPRLGDRIAAA